ncbi:nickel/cobalt efflux system [Kitasatospora herbaricolor]|uniref:HoxN/HupN/NixA family nickel/cobalt transporter n=1 Tax=Kitasatospora herbaricolor TaxID=68217 RepID=UPI00174D3D0F|nr:HoxN/HupN/NixA family nickel/cobalt transporter [Kitasatospora herbaricolor]MDQ0307584.1 high-affinity nickel-transport protein [Kitasatospora herbaricolor]GGV16485.1 nickel/cobalt efflux system [Kitasatospora herbaricolor]
MTSAPPVTQVAPAIRWRDRLTRDEWIRLAGMGGFVLALHVIGWFTLLAVIAPKHYDVGGQVFGVGMGLTAYTLGMRHAFDADHIAAIDNTTRKLMGQGKRPLSVGFWFSLGHSSIVFGLCALLAFGIQSLAGQVESDDSTLHTATGLIGVTVSGVFLVLIGLINLGAFNGILKVFRKMRQGEFDEAELERQLDKRGFMNRILGRVTRAVTKPWHMYPVGLLFGLGFDTATEVSLLVLAGGAAAFSLPWYALLVLPVLFAAGMSLLDTIDGSFMNFAYEWAFSKPVRKIYYNLTVTGLSVIVALVIGVIELVGLLGEKLDITSGPVAWVGELDLNLVGYAIVGLFVLTWAGALAFWKLGKVEEKWSAGLDKAAASAAD